MRIQNFSIESADAGQVADLIGALRAALASAEKSPMAAAKQAPEALRNLLAVIENINLRLADLEE